MHRYSQRIISKRIIRFINVEKKDLGNLIENSNTTHDNREINATLGNKLSPESTHSTEIVSKLRYMEEHQRSYDKRFNSRQYLKNLRFPLLLLAGSALTYYLWNSLPFATIYKHLSISEYTLQNHYWHTFFTSAISFKNYGQLLTYLPGMTFSLFMLARRFKSTHFLLTFTLNSILCGLSTMLYEKNYSLSHDKLMIPKIGGCYTALMYMSCFATIVPQYGLLGTRFLPFWFVPIMFAFYEYAELKDVIVHEISRPSHLTGLFNGFVFGLFLRRYGNLMRL